MKNIAIFASGEGTNTEHIALYFSKNSSIKVSVIVSNKANSGVMKRAGKLGIDAFSLTPDELNGKKILELLNHYHIDLIVLAGYLARIPESILHIFPNRIINIHPALLPKYGGKGMYGINVHKAVIEAGDKVSGITIHYIDKEYDKGSIICQHRCDVLPDDTPESLAARVHQLEYKYYPETIENILQTERH